MRRVSSNMNPNPNVKYPIESNKSVYFIKNTITKPNIYCWRLFLL